MILFEKRIFNHFININLHVEFFSTTIKLVTVNLHEKIYVKKYCKDNFICTVLWNAKYKVICFTQIELRILNSEGRIRNKNIKVSKVKKQKSKITKREKLAHALGRQVRLSMKKMIIKISHQQKSLPLKKH
ncbi:MAG: hypothetical protein H6611_09365 [Ignavibacteriales bacterium]|nr:hypothetical protein [Ignavibacteriales bacterium]